jgi:hypothetical protein
VKIRTMVRLGSLAFTLYMRYRGARKFGTRATRRLL